jgi:ABC-type antimicrobial peptide transport system permease subunit
MKILANRNLAAALGSFGAASATSIGSPAAGPAIVRDIARMVFTAVVAGVAFALLLALAVLSLTVVAPPAHASGAPTVVTYESISPPDAHTSASGKPAQATSQMVADATPTRPAADSGKSHVLPATPAQDVPHESTFSKLVSGFSPGLVLILALVAVLVAFFIYAVARRKA